MLHRVERACGRDRYPGCCKKDRRGLPGSSPAGETPLGGDQYEARSYGSMTYALTKSYLLCGLEPGDRRLDAAIRWLADNYTLDANPG